MAERLTKDEFVTKAKVVHAVRYDYDRVVYVNNRTKVVIACLEHGDFAQLPGEHLLGSGCPKCKSSKGENAIRKWLVEQGYQFKEQVRFTSCRHKHSLPFDFCVGKLLIEFHGQQHYRPYSFRRYRKETQEQKEANLARLQCNDAIKAKWCADNNVPLLVIPYWDQHRIPELLEEFLCSSSFTGVLSIRA